MKHPRPSFYGPDSIPSGAFQQFAVGRKQLDYLEGTDLFNAAAAAVATWTNIVSAQSFTVDDEGSIVLFILRMGMQVISGAAANAMATRLFVDGATSLLVGQDSMAANAQAGAPGGIAVLTGLAAGAHTVAPQYYAFAAGTLYLRASTVPNIEFLGLQVVELKRGT